MGEVGLISGLLGSSGHIFPLPHSAYQRQTCVLAEVQVMIRRGGQSFLLNLFSLIPLALFSALMWIVWPFQQWVYFQSFPAQHQNDLSSSTLVSAAFHTIAALLLPGRSFPAADASLSHLHF